MERIDFEGYGSLYNSDYKNVLQDINDSSIDFIGIDPPYTDGNGRDALAGHKIQTQIDIQDVCNEAFRVLKPNSFFAFFGQMPTIVDWYICAIKAGFKFRIDIVWVKRKVSSPYHKILRTKELIYIFSKGDVNYFKTDGQYEDIKMPLYLDGVLNIETLKRNFADLRYELKNGKKRIVNKTKNRKNDKIYNNAMSSEVHHIDNCNFTDIWSFLPHNTSQLNKEEFNVKHPTVKSIPLLERLIELCAPENAIVLDMFLGSGTTALAAINTNRKFIGIELQEEYFEIAKNRVEKAIQEKESKLF